MQSKSRAPHNVRRFCVMGWPSRACSCKGTPAGKKRRSLARICFTRGDRGRCKGAKRLRKSLPRGCPQGYASSTAFRRAPSIALGGHGMPCSGVYGIESAVIVDTIRPIPLLAQSRCHPLFGAILIPISGHAFMDVEAVFDEDFT